MMMRGKTPLAAFVVVIIVAAGAWLVMEKGETPSEIAARCKADPRKNLCYTSAVSDALYARGLSAAFDVAAAAYDADPSYFSTCHANTHDLGKAAYGEFVRYGEVELSAKTSYCGYGFYHGFVEQMLHETGDFDEAREFCAYVGDQLPEPRNYAEGACYHGIGHGVMDGYDPSTWTSAQALIAPVLSLCEKVADGNADHRYRCDSGIFNSVALLFQSQLKQLATDNPYDLCTDLPLAPVEREACFNQMNTLANYLAGYDFMDSMRYTLQIPDVSYRKIAIRGVSGLYFNSSRSRHVPASLSEASAGCALAGALFDECMTGLIAGIQEFGTPGTEYEDMLDFCSSGEGVEHSVRESCYRGAIESTKVFYGAEAARDVCTRVPEGYRAAAECAAGSLR